MKNRAPILKTVQTNEDLKRKKPRPKTRLCARSTKMQLNKSRQRRVWNTQLVAVWNQTVGLYGINPKDRYTLRVMPYACGNAIHDCVVIPCQSFGLDRKKQAFRLAFFLVGMTGFEPATSWSQTTRATNCATSRKNT